MFEPDTKSMEHTHTLSAQCRTICNSTGVGPQDYRHFLSTIVW